MISHSLPYAQQQGSLIFIYKMRVSRYLQTGILLHLMTLIGVFMFLKFGELAIQHYQFSHTFRWILFGYLSLYGFTLPFFSQLDARSRYQNYKLLKDKIHLHGYDDRLVRPFVFSRCQRDAIKVAGKDTGVDKHMQRYFRKMGFRWYHVIPTMVLRNPRILFTRDYWQKTLMVPTYRSKHFLW